MNLKKEKIKEIVNDVKLKTGSVVSEAKEKSVGIATEVFSKTSDITNKSKEKIITTIDVNNDGVVDIEDIIILALKTPGIKIDRNEFLKKELKNKFSKEVVELAIATTPLQAGILVDDIDHIAEEIIKYERNCVTGISTALGTPGGAAMVATMPADIVQYYGYMLRTAQKLMYLYGFPEINIEEQETHFDTETINLLIICLGVMYGVAGANAAIKSLAKGLATGVSKKIMSTALTKGILYPIVKKIVKYFGVSLTKKMLAGAVQKSLPIIGGVLGGGITYVSFKPCCDKLKQSLQNTMLSNQNYEEDKNVIIDLEI